MKNFKKTKPFAYDLDLSDINREKHKARLLRQSSWWKRKCDRGYCHYCGAIISPKNLTMDHIVPISRGGRTTKGNIVPSCKRCNNEKKQLLTLEWNKYRKKTNN